MDCGTNRLPESRPHGPLTEAIAEFTMSIDTDTLAQAHPVVAKTAEPAATAPKVQSKIHHFTFYNRASCDNVAAFAAAKILVESAIAAERETNCNAASIKRGSRRQQYTVRWLRGGEMAMNSKGADLNPPPQLLGTMSMLQFDPGERAGRSVKVEIRPAQNASADMSAPGGLAGRARGTFDFTVIDGKVTHCLWKASSGAAEQLLEIR